MKEQIAKGFHELESRLDEQEPQPGNVNSNLLSTTDPDASVGKGKQKLQYKIHRSVDEKSEIITATQVTPGAVSEAHQLIPLLSIHQGNTQISADTVVADTAYGTIENYIACSDLGINAHIPDLKDSQKKGGLRNGLFTDDAFLYDPEHNVYRCPAGKELKHRGANKKRKTLIYKCQAKICDSCHLKSDPPPAGAGGFLLYYLDIGIKFWNVRKCFSRIFLYTFYEDFSPISRYPDVMIFCFIDSMGTLATSYTLSYQILTRLDSHYITRQESGVLCGSITALPQSMADRCIGI